MALPEVIFVLGGPGAGKGTQCAKIAERFDYVHLSAGELLRKAKAKQDSVGQLLEECFTQGNMAPVEITCGLLSSAMKDTMTVDHTCRRFLIDGFPPNKDNLDGWNREMSNKTILQFILFFDCPAEICIARCLSRGEQGSGRTDDNMESLKKRFNRIVTYNDSTKPIIDHYDKLGLVRKISAEGSADQVFEEVVKVFTAIQDQ